MDLMVEASPRRVFANAHTYHINSISVNSDCETYLSADDLRINLWNLEITDRSFSILLFFNSMQDCKSVKLAVLFKWTQVCGSLLFSLYVLCEIMNGIVLVSLVLCFDVALTHCQIVIPTHASCSPAHHTSVKLDIVTVHHSVPATTMKPAAY